MLTMSFINVLIRHTQEANNKTNYQGYTMSAKKTYTVIFQTEEIKVRTRCNDFGAPTDCKDCKRCMAAQHKTGFACNLKSIEQGAEATDTAAHTVEPVTVEAPVKPTLEQLKDMFGEDELKAMLHELVGDEPEIVEHVVADIKIKRRSGTKLDRLKSLIKKGVFTKVQLAEQLQASMGTLAVYITKLRKEFGMLIDTPRNNGVVTFSA
jgi:hypothetical protein